MRKTLYIVPKLLWVVFTVFVFFPNNDAIAQTIQMNCPSDEIHSKYAPNKVIVWRLEKGFFTDTISYRSEIKWQKWCVAEDVTSHQNARLELISYELKRGDDAATCIRSYFFKDDEGDWIPNLYVSTIDFVRARYQYKVQYDNDDDHKNSKSWRSNCKILR